MTRGDQDSRRLDRIAHWGVIAVGVVIASLGAFSFLMTFGRPVEGLLGSLLVVLGLGLILKWKAARWGLTLLAATVAVCATCLLGMYSLNALSGGSGTGLISGEAGGSLIALLSALLVLALLRSAPLVRQFKVAEPTRDGRGAQSRFRAIWRAVGWVEMGGAIGWSLLGAGVYGSPLAGSGKTTMLIALLLLGPVSIWPAGLLARKRPLDAAIWMLIGSGVTAWLLLQVLPHPFLRGQLRGPGGNLLGSAWGLLLVTLPMFVIGLTQVVFLVLARRPDRPP